MNQAEQNKVTVEKMHEAMKRGGLTAQLPFFAPTGRFPGGLTDRDGLRAVFEDIQTTVPDLTLEVHALVAEGDRVIGFYTCSGTPWACRGFRISTAASWQGSPRPARGSACAALKSSASRTA